MKSTPILMKPEMIRAYMAGRKTNTRRVIKSQPDEEGLCFDRGIQQWTDTSGTLYKCPYGQPGDELWFRETWIQGYYHSSVNDGCVDESTCEIIYRSDKAAEKRLAPDDVAEEWSRLYSEDGWNDPIWKPSIHMPKWAARHRPKIINIRVERVQDISEVDAKAEGTIPSIVGMNFDHLKYRAGFQTLWDSINGKKPGRSWVDNPLVWVVEFERYI